MNTVIDNPYDVLTIISKLFADASKHNCCIYDIDHVNKRSEPVNKQPKPVNKRFIFPSISRVIYNTGTVKTRVGTDKKTNEPVFEEREAFTTTVFFDDGTKSVVTTSSADGFTRDENGFVSEVSKEAGIVYAIVKRMYGTINEKGIVDGTGFGQYLRKLVKNAYDPQLAKIQNEQVKAKRMAEHAARQKMDQEKAAKRQPSLAKTVRELAATVDKLVKDKNNEQLLCETKTDVKKPAKKPAKKNK